MLDIHDGPDAFEAILLLEGEAVFHKDVLEEDMNDTEILGAITQFNG